MVVDDHGLPARMLGRFAESKRPTNETQLRRDYSRASISDMACALSLNRIACILARRDGPPVTGAVRRSSAGFR
jgi:hypothetical protein